MNKIKESFEGENFEEAMRLAKEILAKEADNATAQYYLNEARNKLSGIKIAQMLRSGINSYEKGDYKQCILRMQEILKLDAAHKEAKRYIYLAETAVSKREISSIIESQRKALEEKDLLALLSHIGSPAFFDQKKEEAVQLFNKYDNIKSLVSAAAINFNDLKHATASFSHLLTGVDRDTGQRRVIFEGAETWTMEKQGNAWKITEYQ